MANITMSPTLKTARAQVIVTQAGATAFLSIYTGVMPSDPSITSGIGSQIVALPMSNPIGVVSAGTLTLSAITQTNATLAGTNTAVFARIQTSATAGIAGIVDLDVAVTGASLDINSTSVTLGGPVAVTASGTFAEQ